MSRRPRQRNTLLPPKLPESDSDTGRRSNALTLPRHTQPYLPLPLHPPDQEQEAPRKHTLTQQRSPLRPRDSTTTKPKPRYKTSRPKHYDASYDAGEAPEFFGNARLRDPYARLSPRSSPSTTPTLTKRTRSTSSLPYGSNPVDCQKARHEGMRYVSGGKDSLTTMIPGNQRQLSANTQQQILPTTDVR